jgi:SNF2 family DNA or RNA helicase
VSTLSVEQLMQVKNPKMTVPGLRLDTGKIPRPYQIVDAAFMLMYPRSILAEYAGAGKKLITIMACLKGMSLMKIDNVLIISLGSDADQWVEDLHESTEGCSIQLYRGSTDERRWKREEEVDFRVTTYQTAVNDMRHLIGQNTAIVLDEVSYIKNPESNANNVVTALCAPSYQEQAAFFQAQAAAKHVPFTGYKPNGPPARYVWGLTATPVETSPVDIWTLMRAVKGNQSPLGDNVVRFKYEMCLRTHFSVWLPRYDPKTKKKTPVKMRMEKVIGVEPSRLPQLHQALANTYIRHPWEVVAPYMPDLQVVPVWLKMQGKQLARYKEISEGSIIGDFIWQESGKRIEKKDVSYALKQFYQRRCCDGLTSLPGQHNTDSVKRNRCLDLIEELDEKLLLFSQWHAPLNDMERKLEESGVPFVRIDGNRDDNENSKARRLFQTDKLVRVCMITTKGSYALNLEAARYGICYNTLFNPKKLEQLYGRTRRGSSKYDKNVWYHLMCQNTVEEAMWQLLRDRQQMSGDILQDAHDIEIFDELTPEEQEAVVQFGFGA